MTEEEHYVCPRHLSSYASGLLARVPNEKVREMRIRLERVPAHDPNFTEFGCAVCGVVGSVFLLRPLAEQPTQSKEPAKAVRP